MTRAARPADVAGPITQASGRTAILTGPVGSAAGDGTRSGPSCAYPVSAVLLFDEPLSNLDARLRRAMREEIRALQQRLKLTVAYVTHDQSEALAVSDQIVVMDRGAIAHRGPPGALYEQHTSGFVAGVRGEARRCGRANHPGLRAHGDLDRACRQCGG